MTNKQKLTVARESKTGLNTHFKTSDGEILTRGQVANNIDRFSNYHVMNKDNKRIIRSNPDRSKNNNLG
ncbi:DUF3892 domain-containing protein [Paraliobacillus sediminis]|uniref:DUF3892 domain-containing protein n=1 Tax=Paraliobacillus sediminis TaxID=1885916 RepID=UPI0013C32E62|nr:DUF3892 domain-containing protein [Paraliobacillus sediminis]